MEFARDHMLTMGKLLLTFQRNVAWTTGDCCQVGFNTAAFITHTMMDSVGDSCGSFS